MAGYSAVLEALRQAGVAARAASETIGGVDAASCLPTGDAGMPGARLVGKVEAVRAAWRSRINGLTSGFSDVSVAFAQAAQRYDANEEAAGADLREATGGRRPV
ncbi:hypothetical protein [Amycolatopsis sp. YIM 10]|uniref:hypothetical protein n=1 Tax=Amycolatopsis sp. YIM 10 TaxID=2653857 RepID=UPI0012906492|nr:hypothetical protein [Amycolatopsis sp. YIM 10]QFU87429.1 hypothetical protein YIM_11135 [Amycolatopsis sp. YIM 10]